MSIEAAIDRISALIGDRLSTAKGIRDHHGEDAAYYTPTPPDAVAFPNDTAEVSEIMKICNDESCPIIPYGVGTSLEGHIQPIRGGVTLDMANMNKVLAIHQEDMDAVVQPAITREALNEDLRATVRTCCSVADVQLLLCGVVAHP